MRVRVNGQLRELTEDIELAKTKKHTIEVVVDRLVVKDNLGGRLADSLETALRLADGVVQVEVPDGPAFLFSERLACAACGISFPEVSPRMFSFNNPVRRLPGLRRHRHPLRDRSRRGWCRTRRSTLAGGALAPVGGAVRVLDLQADAARAREAPRVQPRHAVGQAPEEGARHHPATASRTTGSRAW